MFALISDVSRYPEWRTGVTAVEIIDADESGAPKEFRETSSDGTIHYRVIKRDEPHRMVVQIADTTLPFGGRWTYEVMASQSGSSLRITEDGEVYNPVFRFVSRFIMGHTRTIDRYLADVGG